MMTHHTYFLQVCEYKFSSPNIRSLSLSLERTIFNQLHCLLLRVGSSYE